MEGTNFKIALQKMQADPRYRKLTYVEQQKAVKTVLDGYMLKDQQFQGLDPVQKQTAYQTALDGAVVGLKPSFLSTDVQLTDQDRLRLSGQVPGPADPNDAYKRALWIGERLQKGDPTAAKEAEFWITSNRVLTESLIAKVALGAKDAAEVLFGQDQVFGNDLRFKVKDYNKLSDYLLGKMTQQQQQTTTTKAMIAGLGTGLVETTLLTALGVGTLQAPGLFTKGLWDAVKAQKALATTFGATSKWASTVPYVIEGAGSGVVDFARSLPQLIETGQVDGNGEFWKQAGLVFGQGVAYDVLFHGLLDAYQLAVYPTYKALRGFELKDQKTLGAIADMVNYTDPESWGPKLAQIMKGELPAEWLERIPSKYRKEAVQYLQRFNAMQTVSAFNPETKEGFQFLAKAMGMNIQEDLDGTVKILRADGKVYRRFKTRMEAVSFAMDKSFRSVAPYADEAVQGLQKGMRLRTTATVKQSVKNLPHQQKLHMIGAMLPDGKIDVETTTSVLDSMLGRYQPRYEVLPEKEWIDKVVLQRVPGEVPFEAGVTEITSKVPARAGALIRIPETMSLDTKRKFFGYLDNFAKTHGEPQSFMAGLTTLSDEGLDLAARYLGGTFQKKGTQWTLELPGSAPQVFYERTGLNRAIFTEMLNRKALTDDDFMELFKRSTGYTIDANNVNPLTGGTSYEVWNAHGIMIDRVDDLRQLADQADKYALRLPDFLMPEIVVRNGKLKITETQASGTAADLYKFIDNFASAQWVPATGQKIERRMANGQIANFTVDSNSYQAAVEIPSLGHVSVFDDVGAARTFLDKIGKSSDVLEQIAYDKGYRVDVLSSGALIFRDDAGNGFIGRNLDEVQKFLADKPSKSILGPELAGTLPSEVTDVMQRYVTKALEGSTWEAKVKHTIRPERKTSMSAVVDAMASPFMSWAENTSERLGMPQLYETVSDAVDARRAVSMVVRQKADIVEALLKDPVTGKLPSRDKLRMFGQLLEVQPEYWDTAVKNLLQDPAAVLSEADRKILYAGKTYFEELGKQFNIDFMGFFTSYVPHLKSRATMSELMETLKTGDRKAVLNKMFGANGDKIPAVQFLSRNGRLDDFINVHNRKNLLEMMTYYTEKGVREQYLKRPLAAIEDLAKSLEGKIDDLAVKRLRQFGLAMAGNTPDDTASQVIRGASVALSEALVKRFEKLAEVFGGDTTVFGKMARKAAESSVKENWLEWATKNISAATLGFRPFRIAANLAQFMNTYAVYGHYAMDATKEIDSEYIRRLFRLGVLNERVFAATSDSMEHIQKTISDYALAWQQNTEYLTRAWTAKATELAFDDGLRKYAAGLINFDQFVNVAALDYLGTDSLNKIHTLLKAGSINGARDVAVTDAVRILMFDYAKENFPGLFQGTLGRLYGKFGVYKVGQVDFYRRLWNNRHSSQGYQRILRLGAGSFLVYNAFQSVGVDYNGFKLTDPLDLGGGPVWESLIDITRMGGTGPESQLAKKNFLRNFSPIVTNDGKITLNIPRLAVPGGLAFTGLQKAIKSYNDGDVYGAALDAMSAPHNDEPFDLMNWMRP